MTLADIIAADLTATVFDLTDEAAVARTVSYTNAAGSSVEIAGAVTGLEKQEQIDDQKRNVKTSASLLVMASECPNPKPGEKFTIDGQTWYVAAVKALGRAAWKLELTTTENLETARCGYRMR